MSRFYTIQVDVSPVTKEEQVDIEMLMEETPQIGMDVTRGYIHDKTHLRMEGTMGLGGAMSEKDMHNVIKHFLPGKKIDSYWLCMDDWHEVIRDEV